MRQQLKIFTTLAFVGFALTSCGKKGLSGDIDFEPLPKVPLVINADFTLGSGEDAVIIKAPWYEFRYKFKNNSDQTLVVVTLKMTVTGVKDGAETKGELAIDPGADCGDGFQRPYLAVVLPHETYTGLGADGSQAFSHCYRPTDDPRDRAAVTPLVPPQYESFLFDSLPGSDNNVYSVQIEAQGWFEKSNGEITDRLVLSAFQTTR